MPDGAGGGAAHGDLTGVSLAVVDEGLQIGDAVVGRPLGVDGDGSGVGVDAAEGNVVLIGVLGHVQGAVGSQLPGDHADGVAVGLRVGNGLVADDAAGAGLVVNGNGLAKLLLERGAEGAQAVVRAAAGSPGVDGGDALAGIIRGKSGGSEDGQGHHQNQGHGKKLLHGFSS